MGEGTGDNRPPNLKILFYFWKKDAYQPMTMNMSMNMNPYIGFRKAVNFKSVFSIIQMMQKELKWKNIYKCDV